MMTLTENGQAVVVLLKSEQGGPHASLFTPKEWDCENLRTYRMYDMPPPPRDVVQKAIPPPVTKRYKETGCWTS